MKARHRRRVGAKRPACGGRSAQAIRLFDVFVLGPAMIYASRRLEPRLGTFLGLSGLATIAYNGRNYLRYRGGSANRST